MDMPNNEKCEAASVQEHTKTPQKAALASWIGSALEYYDFFVYAIAAALVLGQLFFPNADPAMGILLALASHGVGYIARPFGAFLLAPLGDRFGRKIVLVSTLILMGGSTFLVGCLPTYSQIGIAAPILLVILRLCQGLSASGEQASANSMTLEHAPENRRAFFTSFTLSGTQSGLILANAVFIPITMVLDDQQLMSWGWRIPFWFSALVVMVGFWIRRDLDEAPAFKSEVDRNEVPKSPLKLLFSLYSPDVLRVFFAALAGCGTTIFSVYGLSYAANIVGIDKTFMLWVTISANIVALFAIPVWALLSDKIGRKPVFIAGVMTSGLLMFPYFWAISENNLVLTFSIGVLLAGVAYSTFNGVWPALFGEMFDTRVRLSGMAIGTQFGFAITGLMPAAAAAIQGEGALGWVPVAFLALLASALASVAVLTTRETFRIPLAELGKNRGGNSSGTQQSNL